ncbi:MAG TPA: ABC transporter permease, partial [Chloroflexota bacterium]
MARATLVLTRPEELQAPLRRPVSRTGLIWLSRFVARKPLGAIGAGIVLLLLFVALFAPLLSPYEYDKGIGDDRLLGPSLSHPFGTDANGRDMLSRIVWGARVSITVGFGAVSLSAVLAVTIGVLSAYLGGWFDLLVQRFVDVWISFPALVLLISLIAVIGPGLWSVTFVLGILLAPGTSRVIRGAVIGVRHLPYMEAARCLGAGHGRIIAHHVLPNVLAPVIVLST